MQQFLSLAQLGTDDNDGDGVVNFFEYGMGGNPLMLDSDGDGLDDSLEVYVYRTNPGNADGDGDGLSDPQELAMGLNPMDPDDDRDGVPTRIEVEWDGAAGYAAGTDMNPGRWDTDLDGIGDLMEIAAGSDPLDAADRRTVRVAGLDIGRDAPPVVEWTVHTNARGINVTYAVQFSSNLEDWVEVGEIESGGDAEAAVSVTDAETREEKGYYRLKLWIE